MFPGVLLLVPIFVLMARSRLVNTYTGDYRLYNFFMPFCIWMLRAYFMTLPEVWKMQLALMAAQARGALAHSFPSSAGCCDFGLAFRCLGQPYVCFTPLSAEAKRPYRLQLGPLSLGRPSWHSLIAGGMISTNSVVVFSCWFKYLVQGLTLGAGSSFHAY